MKAYAIIPAHNEARTLPRIALEAARYCSVIVVDDGSTDDTLQRLHDLPVAVISNPHNVGKSVSLWRGFEQARKQGADCILSLDADGQHAPEDIPRLLERARQQPDALIIAARVLNRHATPPLRLFANRMANFWISWAAGRSIPDTQSGFRVYPPGLLAEVTPPASRHSGFVFESEVLIEAGWRGVPILFEPVEAHYPEDARPSHYRPGRDTFAIIFMVAGRLLRRGLYPQGLYRSLRQRYDKRATDNGQA